jgi:8-oxo-dGTP pyrophosphatase MutT (NUDIX family)
MNNEEKYLGKTVKIVIDRPMGSAHPQFPELIYPVNYGYIPGTEGGDGEEIDVYLLGVDEPVREYTAKIIGIIYREDDAENKLAAAPEGVRYNQAEIAEKVYFQEKYYKTEIDGLFQKSCGAVVYRQNGTRREYLCLFQARSRSYSLPKGHMEAFETEEQTAKREAREEAGIELSFKPGFREEICYTVLETRRKTLVLFLAECFGEPKYDGKEIAAHVWCTAEETKKYLPESYWAVIEKAERFNG